ncbi:MAG TPA: signal recognition particle-docking protein FtsY [Clostridiales bacterium]|nr:signal recognition particle-docking protein FtsY [Clostridiales bacterium]
MGFFSKIKEALSKTRKTLSAKINELFSHGLNDDFYEELEDVLISSDVSVKTSMEIVENIRDKANEQKLKEKSYVIDLLKTELVDLLTEAEPVEITPPTVIMMVGVNGVGKTTTIGKLAKKLQKEGKSVMVAAGDTFRAAASDQLTTWAERANVKIVKHTEGADPSAVVYDAIASAKARKTDVLIVDTAGRLHVKANLMEELKKMDRVIEREYPEAQVLKFIVLDSTTGQNSYSQVEAFTDAIGIDGIVLTKFDGTAKGGFVVSLSKELEVPVVYVGVGEKIDDLEDFKPQEFVDALFE